MDKEEFKYNFLPLKDKIFRIAKRLLNNQEDAEDAVQEIYLKLWNKRYDLDNYKSYEALALVTSKNHCIDKLRTKKKIFSDIDLSNIPANNEFVANTEYNDIFKYIEKAITELPDQQKIIIQLRDIEGFSTEKIKEITGLTDVNIRVNLSRARKKIREILVRKYEYEY